MYTLFILLLFTIVFSSTALAPTKSDEPVQNTLVLLSDSSRYPGLSEIGAFILITGIVTIVVAWIVTIIGIGCCAVFLLVLLCTIVGFIEALFAARMNPASNQSSFSRTDL